MNVQFQLPVGALVNGWRHLGAGRFAADTGKPVGFGQPPHLMEGEVSRSDEQIAVTVVEPFDDPMPVVTWRVLGDVRRTL
jgi:hypothetical protein